jgi:hypothetical protein
MLVKNYPRSVKLLNHIDVLRVKRSAFDVKLLLALSVRRLTLSFCWRYAYLGTFESI